MPRTGVTFDEVAHVCAQLTDAGEKITVRRLQQELGSGSSASVLAHFRRWLTERRNLSAAATTAVDLAPAVRAAIVAEIERQTAAARADSDQRLNESLQLYENAAQALTAAEQQVEELSARLEQERAEAAEKVGGLERDVAALRAQLHEVEQQRNGTQQAFERERSDAENSRAQLLQAKTEGAATLERLRIAEHEAQRLTGELEATRKASSEYERRAILAEATLAAAQGRIGEYKEAESEHKNELAALREELRDAAARINDEVERRVTAERCCQQSEERKTSE